MNPPSSGPYFDAACLPRNPSGTLLESLGPSFVPKVSLDSHSFDFHHLCTTPLNLGCYCFLHHLRTAVDLHHPVSLTILQF